MEAKTNSKYTTESENLLSRTLQYPLELALLLGALSSAYIGAALDD